MIIGHDIFLISQLIHNHYLINLRRPNAEETQEAVLNFSTQFCSLALHVQDCCTQPSSFNEDNSAREQVCAILLLV